jgi:hypothetical protein
MMSKLTKGEESRAKWQHFIALDWYDSLIEFLFRFVAKTSEPLLAAGLVISAADFLTSGALMRDNQAFSMAWAWTQALAIEASSGVVFVYALHSFRQQDQLKAWLYLVLSLLLALTGGAMLLFQLIANTTGMQENALPHGLFYTLAGLRVLVSVSYVYLCRAKHIRFTDLADSSLTKEAQHPQHPAPEAAAMSPDVLNLLIERLEHLSVTVMQLESRETLEPPSPTRLSLPEQAENTQHSLENDATIFRKASRQEREDQPIYLDRFQSKEHVIASVLARKPDASVEEIVQEAGCSTRTASKWMKRLQLPPQGETTKGGKQDEH